jgi:hypothetical protein
MTSTPEHTSIFSLAEARALLPLVKHLTADAVRRAETLARQPQGLAENPPQHVALSESLRDVVATAPCFVRRAGI